MGRLVVIVFMLITAAVLQMAVPVGWFFGGAKAPFLVAVVVYYASSDSLPVACAVAVIAALVHDAMSPIPLGCSVLVFGLIGLIAAELRRVVDMDQWVSRWIMGFASSSVATLILGVVLVKQGLAECGVAMLTAKMIGTGLMGVMVISIVYVVAGSLHRLTGERA